ncbi:hypothetical protein yc1106_05319 [Curvularia clavata]|uniref:Uncharacterized protein n=1 Tax=Curvularia clavata TaxID=95742 RepID=A0A9Q8Z9A9_CURCL|nr:hypothetical protein yc1106_05319 [Curvularia clavata]
MATTHPEQIPDEQLEFTEYTTENGEKFRIGRPKGSTEAKEKADASTSDDVGTHGEPFTLDVKWPSNSSGSTDPGFYSRTGIKDWNVSVGGVFFKYRISFNTDQTYDFQFQDESQQWYECNVYVGGWHSVDYNSDQPNIIRVSGS